MIIVHPFSAKNYQNFSPGYGVSCVTATGSKVEPFAYVLMRAELWNAETRRVEALSTVTPEQISEKISKTCEQLKGLKKAKMNEESREIIQGLVKKVTELNLKGLGLEKPQSR